MSAQEDGYLLHALKFLGQDSYIAPYVFGEYGGTEWGGEMIFNENVAFVDGYFIHEMHLGDWHAYFRIDNLVEFFAYFFHRNHFWCSSPMSGSSDCLKGHAGSGLCVQLLIG